MSSPFLHKCVLAWSEQAFAILFSYGRNYRAHNYVAWSEQAVAILYSYSRNSYGG